MWQKNPHSCWVMWTMASRRVHHLLPWPLFTRMSTEWTWVELKIKGKNHNLYFFQNEESLRRTVWEKNFKMIELHNWEYLEGKHEFTMAMNAFGDLVSVTWITSHSISPLQFFINSLNHLLSSWRPIQNSGKGWLAFDGRGWRRGTCSRIICFCLSPDLWIGENEAMWLLWRIRSDHVMSPTSPTHRRLGNKCPLAFSDGGTACRSLLCKSILMYKLFTNIRY